MKADLVMAIHFHQPVGNFDFVIENICERCYKPFIETLKGYPGIRMSFHITGCLLEWLEDNRPDILKTIKGMVRSGQIEMIAGGFYEPILPVIPERDRLSQIEKLKKYVEDRFNYKAQGAWIAERVWEPSLPSNMSDAGIKYVILDDTHFLYSGVKKEKTHGYYITEDNGKAVAVFPSDKVLRYHLPFKMPEDGIGYMRYIAENHDNPTLIYGDDGEKFGEWPGTYRWVYEEGWLKGFFDKLIENKEWLHTMTFSECLENKKPLGNIYLPTSSYEEMLEWALPSDSQEDYEKVLNEVKDAGNEERYKPYLRGGFWRNFLTKYPESNNMNKKMLYVSSKIDALKKKKIKDTALDEAANELFKGQCNCAYWHGVFGGLYLFHLRSAIYDHLIKSEKLADSLVHGDGDYCISDVLDYDADGQDEVILSNKELSLLFDPAEGGVLKELDQKETESNLMNGLSRKKEAYHGIILEKIEQKVSLEPEDCKTIHDAIQVADDSIKDHLVYDTYPRYSFIDHFISPDVDIDSFSGCTFKESGDFVGAPYGFKVKSSRKGISLFMVRNGLVDGNMMEVSKEIVFPENRSSFQARYVLKNIGTKNIETTFGCEYNFTMPDIGASDYMVSFSGVKGKKSIRKKISQKNVKNLKIAAKGGRSSVKIDPSEPCTVWHFPVETVSQSETSYELNYQGSSVMPLFPLKLKAGEEKTFKFSIKIG